jgi:site-specific recombinase XerD
MEENLWQKVKAQVKIEPVIHHGEKRIKLIFPYDKELNSLVRQLPGVKYSGSMRCWHIPDNKSVIETEENYLTAEKAHEQAIPESSGDLKTKEIIDIRKLDLIISNYADNLTLKNYSNRTIEVYVPFFKTFVYDFASEKIDELEYGKIRYYVNSKIEREKLSETEIKQFTSAIKYYYERVLERPKLFFNLKHRADIEVGTVLLNFSEIYAIMQRINNVKDKTLMLLSYYFGYQPNAIISLTTTDLQKNLNSRNIQDSDKNFIRSILNKYYVEYKPKACLIEKNNNIGYTESEIKQYIQSIVQKYQIIEVYSLQYENALKQTIYSEETKRTYKSLFLNFLKKLNYKSPEYITDNDIRKVLLSILKENKSASTQNQYINSIKFYYEYILKRKLSYEATLRAKKPKQLPGVLSEEEVEDIINSIDNLKHKCIIYMLYSGGLRRSELQRLKITDIDSKRGMIMIKQGKGRKDRTTLLSEQLLELLRKYYKECKPKEYLFEGLPGKQYSCTSMDHILKDALKKASIRKRVTLHMLRHSFATHLLEHGTDIRYIQEILGHNSVKTTQVYTHISKAKTEKILSPGDRIKIH